MVSRPPQLSATFLSLPSPHRPPVARLQLSSFIHASLSTFAELLIGANSSINSYRLSGSTETQANRLPRPSENGSETGFVNPELRVFDDDSYRLGVEALAC